VVKAVAGPAPKTPVRPDDAAERALLAEGVGTVAGLDEVGRGAWAGPVSVGVVVFSGETPPPEGLRDSKLLSEPRREALFPSVTTWCTDWSVGHAGPDECDRWGMTAALRLAAGRAMAGLTAVPGAVLVDGPFDYVSEPVDGKVPAGGVIPAGGSPVIRTVVRGDATCASIAAASIVAKVTRDRMMRGLADSFPGFDFDRNKGYPSPTHRTALEGRGLTSIHRRSWSFVDRLPYR
jgi:ribonuclease HII